MNTETSRPQSVGSSGELGILVEQLATLASKQHYYCDDPWYTCPAHPDGSANDEKPAGVCDCGADAHNAKVNALRLQLVALLQRPNVELSGHQRPARKDEK